MWRSPDSSCSRGHSVAWTARFRHSVGSARSGGSIWPLKDEFKHTAALRSPQKQACSPSQTARPHRDRPRRRACRPHGPSRDVGGGLGALRRTAPSPSHCLRHRSDSTLARPVSDSRTLTEGTEQNSYTQGQAMDFSSRADFRTDLRDSSATRATAPKKRPRDVPSAAPDTRSSKAVRARVLFGAPTCGRRAGQRALTTSRPSELRQLSIDARRPEEERSPEHRRRRERALRAREASSA